MADTLEDFKKEFARIEKEFLKGSEASQKVQQWTGQSSGIIKEACKAIGERVQELKDKGQTGDTLRDFENDPEVKEQLKYIDGYLARTETELKGLAAARNGYIDKAINDFWELKKEVEEEIKKRKKKQQGILKIDSKSLPDMEKLLGELNKYKDGKVFLSMAGMVLETIGDHRKDVNTWISDELSKTKELRLSSQRQDMAERALDIRVLKTNLNRAKGLHDSIKKCCEDAIAAKSSNNESGAKAALVEGSKHFKELNEMAKLYKLAVEDEWIKARISESKDKGTIQQCTTAIQMLQKAASEQLRGAL